MVLALLQANDIAPPPTPARFSPSSSPPPIQCAPSPGVEVKDEDEHENELGSESPDDKIRRLQVRPHFSHLWLLHVSHFLSNAEMLFYVTCVG
jgi:hypothetical protein